jgi:serine/threonine-protein phosphatase 2B regulatory subunit|tara:strand:+ start:216 stop:1313 length:1098 start_codon:yes stop_codon:yes gene_type:complete
MGLCGSSNFERSYQESTASIRKFIAKLNIPEKDVKKVYRKFRKIDGDGSGEVGIDEFFDGFHLTWSTFGQRVFMIMEISGDQKLGFDEFFVGMFNYCTCSHRDLVRFAFDMFDHDHGGSIDRSEVRQLYYMVKGKEKKHSNRNTGRGKRKTTSEEADDLMNKMDKDGDGQIDFAEFEIFEKKMSSLLYPAFTLQREMRKNIIGEGFWNKATKLRLQYAKGQDLIEMNHKLQTGEKLDRKKLKEKAAKREHGRVQYPKGAGKQVTVRKIPFGDGEKVKTLKWQEEVEIFASVVAKKDGRWYQIAEEGTEEQGEWVHAKFIKIDHTFAKMEKAQAKLQAQEKRLEEKEELNDKQKTAGKKSSKYAAR